jgi:membrane-associated protease RseP (regulator of RpoE activity)
MPAINIPPINMPEMDLAGPVVVMHSVSRSGLMVESLTPQLGDYFGAKNGSGVLVRSVEKGSKAEQAGVRAGDVVTKVNGTKVGDCSDFSRLLRSRKDSKVSITVLRERKEQNLTIVLPELKRSGALQNGRCSEADSESCAALFDFDEDVAIVPEMKTAIMERIQPEIARAKKQVERDLLSHKDELKKEMDELQRNLQDQKREIEIGIKRWTKDSEI